MKLKAQPKSVPSLRKNPTNGTKKKVCFNGLSCVTASNLMYLWVELDQDIFKPIQCPCLHGANKFPCGLYYCALNEDACNKYTELSSRKTSNVQETEFNACKQMRK